MDGIPAGQDALVATDFIVHRQDWRQCKFIETALGGAGALEPDEALIKVDESAFTANNKPAAARQSAERATKSQLDDMRRIVAEEKTAHAAADVNAFLQAHHRYRTAWLGCARNPLLVETLARILHSLSLVRLRAMNDSQLRIFIIESHEKLLAALAARNPERAASVQAKIIGQFTDLLLAKIFGESVYGR